MVVSDFPALELAVASTLTLSFFGFLVSRLPRSLPLDMWVSPERCRIGEMPGGSLLSEDQGCLRGFQGDDPVGSGRLGLLGWRIRLWWGCASGASIWSAAGGGVGPIRTKGVIVLFVACCLILRLRNQMRHLKCINQKQIGEFASDLAVFP